MANGVNKVILIGNLGKDPEIQHFDNGVKKASFPLATTETYKGKDGNKVSQTEWHNVILWRGLAEVAETYLKKGHQVYIEGRIKTRTYEKEGEKRYITEIMGDNMTMLGGKRETPQQVEHPVTANGNGPVDEPVEPDDLPF